MDRISESLIQLSDQLDQAGNVKCANIIDDLLKERSLHKVAQYVGVIGYVLKQNRAMGNCVRKKRVASQASMQEVVLECLSEYQDGQEYGTNDWTSKYAEVIQQAPTKFASTHVDFLNAVAEENKLSDHISRVKEAHSFLLKSKIEDHLINEVVANLDELEKSLKEGDDAHRPFKVAAPPSERSRWSRFWSPSWTRRGKDKDAQYEMDTVLESIMNISSSAQQIRSNIARLKHEARRFQNPQLVENINGLSPTDWNTINARMDNIRHIVASMHGQNPDDPEIARPLEVLSDLSGNVRTIHDQISRVQRNMYNLRLRDAVKGRGNLPAATDEYADLDRALSRLYSNPLDEKALHYSQRLHGRLEDALNMRQGNETSGYDDWIGMPQGESPTVPGINPSNPAAPTEPMAPPVSQSSEDLTQSIADDMSRIADPVAIDRFVQMLRSVLPTDISPESRESLNMLADALSEKSNPTGAVEPTPAADPQQTVQTPESTSQEYDFDSFGNADWNNVTLPGEKPREASSELKTLRKMADAVAPLDEALSRLLSEYLQEAEEELPQFPETCSVLKEKAASRLKLTQKKGGEVVVNT